ncbi:MAG: hypothetical protein OZSIB_2165 [Candidatus Ozemobacter sibiricus]|uniref:LPS export ABC transporter periplasmic protein LptC n=1 Tax=Candidatus Ozemobacter sibiricus TaxID=2268124 RepID=A0A367ZTC3_9BACT|nr:MAG: hypothetical protein OZSIB_2165 [Candidatus Ozemobacter sibiricus]
MNIFAKGWFWFLVLLVFLVIILKDDSLEKDLRSTYAKARMRLRQVHFSEIDQGFEHARLYAVEVDMDDSQTNMNATQVQTLFFDKQVATRTGQLVASWAFKTPFEARFWGDVRLRSSDGERMRTEELRYFFSRKELYTSMPVTIWKDNMIITGREFRFNTQTRAGSLERDVLIRIWPAATSTVASPAPAIASAAAPEDAGHFVEIPSSQFEEETTPPATARPDDREPASPPAGIPKPTARPVTATSAATLPPRHATAPAGITTSTVSLTSPASPAAAATQAASASSPRPTVPRAAMAPASPSTSLTPVHPRPTRRPRR